jgi:peptidoglycan/xylan/chitin deacetylase (PgdA/CDA1 family)
MTHLKKVYRPVPLVQLAMAAREGWLPDRAVAVTFDDGYADNLEIASPILLELGIPATFFITSDGLLGRREVWWDVLAEIFFGPSPLPDRLALDGEGETGGVPTTTSGERERAHWEVYHRLRAAGHAERDRLIEQLKQWAGVTTARASGRLMNRGELEDLAQRPGHSIGGHGAHHLSFSAHPQDVVRREVEENRTLLEVSLGRIVTTFAYPFGDHDDRSVEVVRDVGYRAAVTCLEGLVRPGIDPLRLPRITVAPLDAVPLEERLRALF